MSLERYRLRMSTCAISIEEGRKGMVTVPAGSFIEIGDFDVHRENSLSDVHWKGKAFRMFTVDLLARAERLKVKAN